MDGKHWVMMITELRRFPQVSYKAELSVLSGLDEGDMKAIDASFKNNACHLDKEDGRFVLRGPSFNPMMIINTLTEQRSYQIEYNPQQHNIPLKQHNMDDKVAIIYHLSKPSKKSHSSTKNNTDPLPPPRTDSLPANEAKKQFLGFDTN